VNWEDTIVEAAATDTGMRRSNNQDSYTIVRAASAESWRQRGHLFMVADGMGAHAVGELASKMACDNIPLTYTKAKKATVSEAIVQAYRAVGAQIHSRAALNKDFQGMGTTCSTLLLLPEGALIAHVGDSRIYRVRQDRIEQFTFDHSLVWELVRRNHLTLEEAQRDQRKNVITRSLGPEPNIEVDVEGPLSVALGDVFVLCTDGLSGLVADPEIGALATHFHPEAACRYLIHLANLRGGLDNITVIVVRIGPWVEPNSSADVPTTPAPRQEKPKVRAFFTRLFTARKSHAVTPAFDEHPYRAGPCPIDGPLLDNLTELVRQAQAAAIENSWNLDWSVLANYRREAEEARAAGDLRGALRCLGESIVILGHSARVHRKTHGPAPVS
jgi:serine/threonine protein phosphatase PrpC